MPRPKTAGGKKNTPATQKAPGKAPRNQSLLKKATTNAAHTTSPTPTPSTPAPTFQDYPTSPSPAPSLKRKAPHDEQEEEESGSEDIEDEDADAEGDMEDGEADGDGEVEADTDSKTFDFDVPEIVPEASPSSGFSKEQEIEKLRTSGSMTQSISEIARVKNLNRLQIGKHEVDAWYFSPYPKEYAHLPILYICEFCLSFFPSPMMLSRHRLRCTSLHPPGNEIYRYEDISFFEIDGKRQLTWCRNLSLLSKCFLDQYVRSLNLSFQPTKQLRSKTLYYDVTPFMYYVMVSFLPLLCYPL